MQIKTRQGEFYDKWREGMRKAVDRQDALAEEAARVLDGDIPWEK